MSDQLTTVRIESDNHNASTPVLVNGQLKKRIPHNVDTGLTPEEFEALRNSNIVFKLVGGAIIPAQPVDDGAEGGLSAPSESSEGSGEGEPSEHSSEDGTAFSSQADLDALGFEPLPEQPEFPTPEEGAGSTLNVEPFHAEGTLKQSIRKISEDLDEFTAEQVEALIKAEKAAQKRVTLIEALERKLTALRQPEPPAA